MLIKPPLRKFLLTAHIVSSVGWLGAVAGFLVLAIAGLTDRNIQIVRSVYIAMQLVGWFVIVPFSLASLLTGLVQSLGTKWGLFRYYWVSVKFLLTVFSIVILFVFTKTLGNLGDLAADTTLTLDELRNLSQSPVLHSGGGLLVLLAATTLSVYKPWGLTGYGRRKRQMQITVSPPSRPKTKPGEEETHAADLSSRPESNDETGAAANRRANTGAAWRLYVLLGIVGLLLLFAALHLDGGGFGGH